MTKLLLIFYAMILISSACNNDRSLVVGKIRKSAQLATTQFTIDKLVYGTQNKKLLWVFNLNESRFLAQS